MSGMVGIFRRDGSPAAESSVQTMVNKIRHRGPDRSGLWTCGAAGFGHAMLCTTPESLEETLPWCDSSSGFSITSDARIDNREELSASLGLKGSHSDISDSRLILKAYEKWGASCPQKLIGDFAFAIWNKSQNHLFCARDPMGIKGLYYFASGDLFAFASEIKSLCCLPEIPARLNELRVLDYLANIFEDREITFYKDIYRLPAASTLTVTRDKVRVAKYWTLDPTKELKLKSDEEYTEAFRDCFLKSVKSRMRSAYPVGAALSGGLDSSSIACAARNFSLGRGATTPLQTFSLIFPSLPQDVLGQIDERKYIDEVLKSGGFQPTFVRADQHSPLGDVKQVQEHLDEAFFAGNLYLHWAMYETASKQGARVFLDGLDGDTTVSHGLEYLSDLIVRGKWMTLWTEVTLVAAQMETSPRRVFREYCIRPLCPTWAYTTWRLVHGRPDNAGKLQTFMTPEFSRRLRLDDRVKALVPRKRKCFTTAREKHREMLMFPLYAHALEAADKSTAAFGIEGRYPFFDQRLIELCLSLPAGQKLSQGWSRAILRRAMAGILPESVRWRQSKADLSSNFYLRLLDHDRELLDDVLLTDSSDLEPYVNLDSIRRAYGTYNANPTRSHDDSVNIFSAVNLAIWLRTAGVRP
jgi:asparagine synthase (glutamine-hydrolysing)